MTVSEVTIDLSGHSRDLERPSLIKNMSTPIIEYLTVDCQEIAVQAPEVPEFQPPLDCPALPELKYSGDTVTLQATPSDGIGPYYVEFFKGEESIHPSRLGDEDNPITDAPEDTEITRIYTLDDEDIRTATEGTIDFSVYIKDKCPTGAQICQSVCTVNIGCLAPVCNFTVS